MIHADPGNISIQYSVAASLSPMHANPWSRRLSSRIHHLNTFRFVLLLAAACLPAFGILRVSVVPEIQDPFWLRAGLGALGLSLVCASFSLEGVRASFTRLATGYFWLISAWSIYLVYANGFSPATMVVFLSVLAGAGVGMIFLRAGTRLVVIYALSMAAALAGGAVLDPDPRALVFLPSFATSGLVIFVALSARRQSDEDRHLEQGLFLTLFEDAAAAHVLLETERARVIDYNSAFARLLDLDGTDLRSQSLTWITGLSVLDECAESFVDGEHAVRTRTGRVVRGEVSARRVRSDDRDVTLVTIVDVTAKRLGAERSLREAERASAVAELSRALSELSLEQSDALQMIARTVTSTIADLCVIRYVPVGGDTIVPVAVSHRDSNAEDLAREIVSSESLRVGQGPVGRVIETGEPIWMSDTHREDVARLVNPRYHPYVDTFGVRSYVVLPLVAHGDVIGAALVTRDGDGSPFTTEDGEFLRDIVDRAGLAVGNIRLLEDVKRREARFRSLVQNSSDLILRVDHQGALRYVSPSVRHLLGYDPEQLLGTTIFDLTHPRDLPVLVRESYRIRDGKEVVVNASRFRTSDGQWRWLEAVANNMLSDPAVEGVVINARDVTERIRHEAELRAAKETAEEMSRLKDSFLANMSHEIRTPLTAIIGFASVLSEELSENGREFAEYIHFNGNRLMDALNSVLDLARLEAGGLDLELDEVDLCRKAQETAGLYRQIAADRGLMLSVQICTKAIHALVDEACFDRILNNLVGNAIKFTESGGVTVRVEADDLHAHVCVEDTGIGIGDDFLPHLFTAFRQESCGFGRSHEGTGLGLTITKQLVELMGGTISVESRRGGGSNFRVSVPIRKPSAAYRAATG